MPRFDNAFRQRIDWMVLTDRKSDAPLTWPEVVSFAKKELHSIKWGDDKLNPIPEVTHCDLA